MPEPINLGPRAARQRAIGGVLALLPAAALFVLLASGVVPAVWIVPFAVLVWLGALGVLQARAKT